VSDSTFDREGAKKLLGLVEELGAKRGITLPPADPFPEQDVVYHQYLGSMGLDPDRVDRIMDMGRIPDDQRGVIHAMLLQGLMQSGSMSDQDLKGLLFLIRTIFSEQRATGLLRTISAPILGHLRASGDGADHPLAIGVLPLRSFNGQSTVFEDTAICLLDTGSFDLIEIFTTLFDARRKDPGYATTQMRNALDTYVRNDEVSAADFDLGRGLVDFGNVGGIRTRLTTSAEQFLVAHEIAHVALGHLDGAPRGAMPIRATERRSRGWIARALGRPTPAGNRATATVIQPAQFDEHCADVWALKTVIDVAQSSTNEGEVPIACGGAALMLGLAMLTEAAWSAAGIENADSHPPALTRLYLVEVAFELLGQHENAYVARRVREFVEEIGEVYHDFEMPPMLDRSMNKTAGLVFKHLGLDLSNAPYITEFQ
jgi:hypothetical protein